MMLVSKYTFLYPLYLRKVKQEVEPKTIFVKLLPLQLWASIQKGASTFDVLCFYIMITLTQSNEGALWLAENCPLLSTSSHWKRGQAKMLSL